MRIAYRSLISSYYSSSNTNAYYAPPTRPNYGFYPSANNDTYIYEQSICSKSDIISNSEFDAVSMTTFSSAFSPAMSTDSTLTLKSPILSEFPMEEPRNIRSATPAIRPNFTSQPQNALQGPVMSRVPSSVRPSYDASSELADERRRVTSLQSRPVPPARGPASANDLITQVEPPVYLLQPPEYAASTFSDFEVEERDRIAQINAEYNSAPSAALFAAEPSTQQIPGAESRRRSSSPPQNVSPSQRDAFPRSTTSQPLHPDLNFPTRPPGLQDSNYSASAFQQDAGSSNPVPFSHNSPPSVERISSQLPPEEQVSQNAQPRAPYLDAKVVRENWSRDANFESDFTSRTPISRATNTPDSRSIDRRGSASPTSRTPAYAASSGGVQDGFPYSEQRQDRPFPTSTSIPPPELSRQRSFSDRRPSSSSYTGSRPSAAVPVYRDAPDIREYDTPRGGAEYRQQDLTSSLSSATGVSTRGSQEPASFAPRDYPSGYAGSSESRRESPVSNSASYRDNTGRAASDSRREARTAAPRDGDWNMDEQQRRPAYPSRRDSYIYAAPDTPSRNSKAIRTSPEYNPGPLTSSPKQMRVTPAEFDVEPTSNYPTQPYEPDRVRTRSTSFSSSSRPTLPIPSTQTSNGGYRDSNPSKDTSEYDRDRERDRGRRSRSSSVSDKPPPSRSSDHQPHPGYETAEPVLRDDPHRAQNMAAYMQTPSTSLSTRERDVSLQETYSQGLPPRHQAATVQTASPTVSSKSSDSRESRKAQEIPPTPGPDSRTPYFDAKPHQQFQQGAEPRRRQSDGERPYTSSGVAPGSNLDPYDSRYEPLFSSSSSSSSTNSNPPRSTNPIHPPFPEPQRRYSDGDQQVSTGRPKLTGRNSSPLVRSVRWTDNLIAPSPILANQRRKGWFNRRG